MDSDEVIDLGRPLDDGYAIAWRHRAGGFWWIDSGTSVNSAVLDDFGCLVPRAKGTLGISG